MLQELQEKNCAGDFFSIKLHVSDKKKTPIQVFSSEFCEVFKNTSF